MELVVKKFNLPVMAIENYVDLSMEVCYNIWNWVTMTIECLNFNCIIIGIINSSFYYHCLALTLTEKDQLI